MDAACSGRACCHKSPCLGLVSVMGLTCSKEGAPAERHAERHLSVGPLCHPVCSLSPHYSSVSIIRGHCCRHLPLPPEALDQHRHQLMPAGMCPGLLIIFRPHGSDVTSAPLVTVKHAGSRRRFDYNYLQLAVAPHTMPSLHPPQF